MHMFNQLPCLRCGKEAIIVPFFFKCISRDTFDCQNCEATMYLAISNHDDQLEICYDRYTLRYPLEHYDESHPIIVKCKGSIENGDLEDGSLNETLSGPVFIFPRKKYFNKQELELIWKSTNGQCHICKSKKWKIDDRSRNGWHVDHVIPNYGGGEETERLSNFKIACARCNLSKGKGYTDKSVHNSLKNLLVNMYGLD